MRFGLAIAAGIVLAMSIGSLGCQDDGSMAQAGEQFDEKIEEAHDELTGQQGVFETLGEKLDEAAGDAREKLKAAEETADAK